MGTKWPSHPHSGLQFQGKQHLRKHINSINPTGYWLTNDVRFTLTAITVAGSFFGFCDLVATGPLWDFLNVLCCVENGEFDGCVVSVIHPPSLDSCITLYWWHLPVVSRLCNLDLVHSTRHFDRFASKFYGVCHQLWWGIILFSMSG